MGRDRRCAGCAEDRYARRRHAGARNPVLAGAALAGAGLLWYAARRKAKQAQDGPIEGTATRIEARKPAKRARKARSARTAQPTS